ncbi:hypothetical protein EVA_13986 [gut metagenome]|uniref:Uncharacterized protein n=1 Tax=gut metagenome TaxID=749906 RepID=J9GEX6_9ZZZZ
MDSYHAQCRRCALHLPARRAICISTRHCSCLPIRYLLEKNFRSRRYVGTYLWYGYRSYTFGS